MRAEGRVRVLVLGYLVRGPIGGLAWHHLQYVLGLERLGHDVYFLEDSDDYPACYDPSRAVTSEDPGYGLRFAARALERLGLKERWAYHDAHTGTWHGPLGERMRPIAASADLLLNVSGMNPLRPWVEKVPARALIDTDPAFTQIRHLRDPSLRARAMQHTAFFSFAGNIGSPRCDVPDDGLPWRPTRQPVVLDAWPVTPPPARGPFTTVMQWESYPAREHAGRRYGMKADSFAPYLDLPRRTRAPLELAVGAAPRALLEARGWRLRDALEVTSDPWTYQAYLRRSSAELGIAKHGYVASHSGWFSERSACYLASGRPVLAQETGFSDWLPTGRGVLSFRSCEEALAGIEEVEARLPDHARAAREVAASHFEAGRVLEKLVEESFSLREGRP
jgi:hypothetical protein